MPRDTRTAPEGDETGKQGGQTGSCAPDIARFEVARYSPYTYKSGHTEPSRMSMHGHIEHSDPKADKRLTADLPADAVVVRKIRAIYSQSRIGALVAVALWALMGYAVAQRVGWPDYLAWYAVVVVIYGVRQAYYALLIRQRSYTSADLNRMAWFNALAGLIAVSCVPIFGRGMAFEQLAFLTALMISWAAVSVTVLFVRPRVYRVYVLLNGALVLLAWWHHLDIETFVPLVAAILLGMSLLSNVAQVMERQFDADVAHQRAITDGLTRLANREGISADGDSYLSQGVPQSVLVLDLDRFKAINDALGYEFGDAVLVEVANRMRTLAAVKVGRLHASQFCIIMRADHDPATVVSRVQELFAEPLSVLGESVDVRFSIGVSTAPAHGRDMQTLIRAAALASHEAQRANRGWMLYQPGLNASSRADLSLLSRLRSAAQDDGLLFYLQPKVNMATGSVDSAEALIRWRQPSGAFVPPVEFIPFAEQTGSMRMLTDWMLRKAMQFTSQCRQQGRPIQVSVNISVGDLRDDQLALRAHEWASQYGALPADIRFEITESSVMNDPDFALAQLQALREAGFSLSIDDFGTGYSSLAYLQKMPVQEMKIDRSFVSGVQRGTPAEALLDSIIAMSHRLGLSVVAEGVETREEWEIVRKLGCDYAQGWFMAQAMPCDDFLTWRERASPFVPQ